MPVTFPNGDPRRQITQVQRAMVRAVRRAVETTVINVEARAKDKVNELNAVDRGTLKASIGSEVKVLAPGIVEGVAFVGAGYGQWVEYGRRGLYADYPGIIPGKSANAAWPPVDAINGWVRRKLGLKPDKVNVAKSRFYQRYPAARKARVAKLKQASLDKKVDEATFLIGRAIAWRGIRPRAFFWPAVRDEARKFNRRLSSMINAEIKKALLK